MRFMRLIKMTFMIANTPKPPYYAVIFSSVRTENDTEGYAEMAERIAALDGQMLRDAACRARELALPQAAQRAVDLIEAQVAPSGIPA